MNKEEKIFIAGGSGLVGGAILKTLLQKGYSNITASCFSKKTPASAGPAAFVSIDLGDQSQVARFFAEERPDYVFLAAAKVGGILANNTYRADFIYENLQIQNNVIHYSHLNKVRKLLFLGSSCIYPRESPQPMREEYLLTGPLEYTNEPYATAKIAGLKMCESYSLQYGDNFISVMPTNLFGPNDNFDLEKSHVIPALIRKMHLSKLLNEQRVEELLKDLGVKDMKDAEDLLDRFGIRPESIEIWGSGMPRREFLYIDDLADACVFVMENVDFTDMADNASEVRNTHINIGAGKDMTIREIAETIKDVIGYEGSFVFNTSKPDGTMRKLLDVSRISALGWRTKVGLREAITKTYEAYIQKASRKHHSPPPARRQPDQIKSRTRQHRYVRHG